MSKKQFLYLDVDMVNSIIAQEEKGLVTQWENEKSRTEGGSDDDHINVNTSGKASGSLFMPARESTHSWSAHSTLKTYQPMRLHPSSERQWL